MAENFEGIVETDVEIATPDGTCNAAFIYRDGGAYPGVLIWADAFGLRHATREMGKRLAAAGYAVLVPNPFYRVARAPFSTAAGFDFNDPASRDQLKWLIGSVVAPGNAEKDSSAYIAFLDAQKGVDKSKKIGTQGYCMGGQLALRSAAVLADRIGAVASFHGGGLVTEKPDSPHLLAPKITAQVYVGIAENDDAKQPEAKDKLKESFAAAHVPAEVEVYKGAMHGWCMTDSPAYNQPAAERAWSKLLALYSRAL